MKQTQRRKNDKPIYKSNLHLALQISKFKRNIIEDICFYMLDLILRSDRFL